MVPLAGCRVLTVSQHAWGALREEGVLYSYATAPSRNHKKETLTARATGPCAAHAKLMASQQLSALVTAHADFFRRGHEAMLALQGASARQATAPRLRHTGRVDRS